MRVATISVLSFLIVVLLQSGCISASQPIAEPQQMSWQRDGKLEKWLNPPRDSAEVRALQRREGGPGLRG